jgi:hypothetical protein
MTNKLSSFAERLTVLASAYRKTLWSIAAGVAVYALLGFFLAPWLLQKSAIEAVSDNLHAELRLDHVAINPFMLSLRIDGLQLDASSGEEVANIDQVFINFQLSSLFRWAWTFDEFYITSPQLFVARDEAGAINLAGLANPPALPADKPAASAESSPVRLLIHDFAIRDSVAHWNDRVPPEPVETTFGPINIEIAELNTLPQRAGQQAVEITTEFEGTLSWSGSLQLNPISSAGRASIKGTHFPLISAYRLTFATRPALIRWRERLTSSWTTSYRPMAMDRCAREWTISSWYSVTSLLPRSTRPAAAISPTGKSFGCRRSS